MSMANLSSESCSQRSTNGALRDVVWNRVAQSDPFFEAMLTGARYDELPANFQRRVARAKWEMERRLNGPYRQRVKEVLFKTQTGTLFLIAIKASKRETPVTEALDIRDQSIYVSEDDNAKGPTLREVDVPARVMMDTVELEIAPEREQTPRLARLGLSVSIQNAVEEAVGDLKAKIADLEEREAQEVQRRNRREAEFEEKLLARVEASLAQRDVEIQRLKSDLNLERLWRES